jgi:carbonic anhydrase
VEASIEYAVEHLGSKSIVMGHERCGAVGAALEGESLPGTCPR